MDHEAWRDWGLRHLGDARTAGRADLYRTVDAFRGLSPYDQHGWYRASKSMINMLFWATDLLAGPEGGVAEDAVPLAVFADRLAVYRRLADAMIRELDTYDAAYQREFDVKGPPELLETVRDRATAFRATIQQVIDAAPPGLIRDA